MKKILSVIFLTILTSFYFFPFEFVFLPGINTKLAMACIGLPLIGIRLALNKTYGIRKDIFKSIVMAALVSLVGVISVVFNDTNDFTYATYLISMLVWLSAAYVLICCIRKLHGTVSVEIVCNYLILVCTIQCVIAYSMEQVPVLKSFVDSFVAGEGFMGKSEERLYGIGASLDVAGSRFSCILIMIMFLINRISGTEREKYMLLYLAAYFIIAVIGNMMSRSTTVGLVISLVYFIFTSGICRLRLDERFRRVFIWFSVFLAIGIPFVVYKYNTDYVFHENLRFGFEGFFSLSEKGEWDVHSNNILKNMVVFPDNTKTWIIGDGYFSNPYNDPYYIGELTGGFYKGTDIGYLRFIFYFGVTGMLMFIAYMFICGRSCMERFGEYRLMFLMILIVNYIIWFKVSTDVFLVFALFMAMEQKDNYLDGHEEEEA